MTQNFFLPSALRAEYDVKVPMRDGVNLSADIFLPTGSSGPFPVLLSRTPYGDEFIVDGVSSNLVDNAVFYVQHGYVYVIQNVRGRNDSDGEFYPMVNELEDGHDTLEWIGAQTWCDGNVGMIGASYVGIVQWQCAIMGSPYLKAIAPEVIGNNLHDSAYYQGGAFNLALCATWVAITYGRTMQEIDLHNWDQVFYSLPLRDVPQMAGKNAPHYRDWIDHPDYDDYWKAQAVQERYEDVKIPVFQIGGWYDLFPAGTFINYNGMLERGGSELARSNQKVLMGPWIHMASYHTHAGEADFGKDSVLDLNEVRLKWFDRWLKGIDNGVDREAPIRLFVMGTNEWRDEDEWPLARTRFTPYYFHSGGSANSLQGDGRLSTQAPAEEAPDRYDYNPMFPVPTEGGANCCVPDLVLWGAVDQRRIEYRNDVMVYTSDPLEEDLEVTGPIVVKLHASTDATDTDFTAKLVDVHPDGYALNLCDGIIRGRYRETMERQKLLEPGTVYEFTIDLWATSNVFLKGHRIRVDVSSSNFPRFDRNPNTGHKFGVDTDMQVARQQVFHDAAHASHILLPVIPKS